MNKVKVFPNPTSGKITIEGENITHISVFNNAGQIIKQTEVEFTPSFLDLNQHPKGMYFIKVKTNEGLAVKRIVIE